MSKAENTYWTSMQSTPSIKRRASKKGRMAIMSLPNKSQWWAFGVTGTMTLMLCLTINFRAFSELNKEATENSSLDARIQSVTNENLALQEEIHYLKNDSHTVEREARKFGLRRSGKSRDAR